MDSSVQRLLNDKLYEKRKQGALEYVIRTTLIIKLTDSKRLKA